MWIGASPPPAISAAVLVLVLVLVGVVVVVVVVGLGIVLCFNLSLYTSHGHNFLLGPSAQKGYYDHVKSAQTFLLLFRAY